MERQIRIDAPGDVEVMQWVELDLPDPGPGEVRMRHSVIGLNFIDTCHRRGIYPLPLPSGLGMEAAGVVEAVGAGVTDFRPGDRVCTFGPLPGAYATARNLPAALLFHTPGDISDELAAAALLKGCTAEFLIERCARVQPGDTVLVHAAAGGVGLMLVQWLHHLGARVIGTTSTAEKADVVRAAGAEAVILYTAGNVAEQVRALTGGDGVRVTFDSVGLDTWQTSLDATGRRGMIVNYGTASGTAGLIDPGVLLLKGSLFNARPALYDYYVTPEERAAGAARVFDLLQRGVLNVTIGQRYTLAELAQAHRDLEGRRTIGSSVMTP